MDLEVVSFPALIIADDGWVDYFESSDRLSQWTWTAVRKYRGRCVVLFDERNCAWQVESIAPIKELTFLTKVILIFRNSKLPVRIRLTPITEAPIQQVQRFLRAAVEADDDILTQNVDAKNLNEALEKADSFKSIVGVLRERRVIWNP